MGFISIVEEKSNCIWFKICGLMSLIIDYIPKRVWPGITRRHLIIETISSISDHKQ
jgi:hypothetical protein